MAVKIGEMERFKSGRIYRYKYDELVLHAIWLYWRQAGSGPTVGDLVGRVPEISRQTLYDSVRRLEEDGDVIYDDEFRKVVPTAIAATIKRIATGKYKEVYSE